MSKIVRTELGKFRYWTGVNGSRGFLLECPSCGEWLPLSEEHLNGSKTVEHENPGFPDTFCSYSKAAEYGSILIATMQARILMDEKPSDEL